MKKIRSTLFCFLLLFLCHFSCDKPEVIPIPEVLTIMPLGDSRVGGGPSHESYRYELWKLLIQDQLNVDFVGTNYDTTEYPLVDGLAFDRDHEGTGGARTTDILETVELLDPDDMPKVVLLGIGGNDLASGERTVPEVKENIIRIIDIFRSKKSNITIFLEQIAPGRSDFMTTERWTLFEDFKVAIQQISDSKNEINARVIPIDMSVNWSDSYMADVVHYNEQGAEVIADHYFSTIREYIRE